MNQIHYMGHPLWTDVANQVIVEFATEKILCNSKKAKNIYETDLLQQASELVSSHMRILRHVNETRESLVTACLSEPVLAEAASYIMNQSGILVQVLGQLVSSIRNHIIVNAGDQSELVGRILCLLAINKSIQSKPKVWNMYSQTITIQKFFDTLVGQDAWKKLSSIFTIQANSITLCDSKIRFNHFVYIEGVDIIIPVVMVQDDKTPITEENVMFIGIQVRNHEADGSTARYIGIDDCKSFLLPYLGIYISLGVTSEDIEYNNTLNIGVKTQTEAKDRIGHLSIYGLSKNVYACFNGTDVVNIYIDPVKKNGILWGRHNASNEWVQQYKEIIKNMEPLQYNKDMVMYCLFFCQIY
ncbi:hypothetical protein G9A89_000789 [Geosiphon pyriformis]|nr:hypothetical protein G9A89_000789 [Geosiphon pyriformis]